jgi:hypothetical protein
VYPVEKSFITDLAANSGQFLPTCSAPKKIADTFR